MYVEDAARDLLLQFIADRSTPETIVEAKARLYDLSKAAARTDAKARLYDLSLIVGSHKRAECSCSLCAERGRLETLLLKSY